MYFQFCCTLKNVYVALYILFGGTLTQIGFPTVTVIVSLSSCHECPEVYKLCTCQVVCLQEAEILQILANTGLVKSELNEI